MLLDRNEKGQFTKYHVPWLKGIKGKQPWHNTLGLRSHKKGEFKHKRTTKNWISLIKREMYEKGLIIPWNKGLHIQLNTGRTHFKKNVQS